MPNQEPVADAISQYLAQPSLKEHHFVIALSGGADSVALLHALSRQLEPRSMTAVYIDHQLQSMSSEWAQFNRDLCQRWGIRCHTIAVNVNTDAASLESEARKARYEALADFVKNKRTHLLTAHHKNDQIETLLLQLFRGAGPKGLSAMPAHTDFSHGFHDRPLLQVSRQDIMEYCSSHQLSYVEDPSNEDTRHRRNFLRKNVLPLLKQEWPQLEDTLYRVSELQADTQSLLEEVAEQDFDLVHVKNKGINLSAISTLSSTRQGNVLRFWLSQLQLVMPSQKILNQLMQQMLQSAEDSQPEIPYQGGVFRRHAGFLHWESDNRQSLSVESISWDGQSDLNINESLSLPAAWLKTRHPELVGKSLSVSTRQGGERFRKINAKQTTSLKNYLQDIGVPSWQRSQLLLISYQNEVRAIYSEHLENSV